MMNVLLKQLEDFFKANGPVIIVNTSTNAALLCLRPNLKMENGSVLVRFESLNERGGNSVTIKSLQGFEKQTLYLENEDENVLMLQALNLENYNQYIKKQYLNAPSFVNESELESYILAQNDHAW
jgi:hypothetical protein